MKKNNAILLILIFAIMIFVFFRIYQEFYITKKVCFKDSCYNVELAQSALEKEKGLMYRNHLDSNRGMFFIFENEGMYSFWMKNTLIPLDMIWLDRDLKVVYILKNAQPCGNSECQSAIPDKPAHYVLELNAGEAERIGLKNGDIAIFK